MRLNQIERNVNVVGNLLEKRAAKIELNPIIFEILSGKIYSNKILAVIRELSCNAVDAHNMAGNTNQPFDVQLPTLLEPVFRIRDYGVGLSHEDVFNLYMTFGASSKRDSDTLIGGLGIGSKAPLAYTSAFTVTSYFNGEQRSYSVFIDEDGRPATSHLHTLPTNEPNGLEVSVPVKTSDIQSFNSEASGVYRFFDIKPNFVGHKLDIEPIEFIHKFKDWGIYKNSYYDTQRGAKAIMGNIAYPLSERDIRQHKDWAHDCYSVVNDNTLIYFDIGELDIAASREALSYTPRTQAKIIERLKKIKEEANNYIKSQISTLKGEWETCKFYKTSYFINNGWNINPNNYSYGFLEFYESDFSLRGDILNKSSFNLRTIKLKKRFLTGIAPYGIDAIVLNDKPYMTDAKIRTLAKKLGTHKIFVVEPFYKSEDYDKFLKRIEGGPEVLKMSELPIDEEFLPVKKTRTPIQVTHFTGYKLDIDYSKQEIKYHNYYAEESITPAKNPQIKHLIIPYEGPKKPVIGNKKEGKTYLNYSILSCLFFAGGLLDDKNIEMYLVHTTKISKKLIKNNKNVLLLDTWLKDDKTKKNILNQMSLYKKRISLRDELTDKLYGIDDYGSLRFLVEDKGLFSDLDVKLYKSLKEYFKNIDDNKLVLTASERRIYDNIEVYFNKLYQLSNNEVNILDKHKNLTLKDFGINIETIKEVYSKYPMLTYLNTLNKNSLNIDVFKDYIKLCMESETQKNMKGLK